MVPLLLCTYILLWGERWARYELLFRRCPFPLVADEIRVGLAWLLMWTDVLRRSYRRSPGSRRQSRAPLRRLFWLCCPSACVRVCNVCGLRPRVKVVDSRGTVCAFSRTSCPHSLARRPTLRCSGRLCRRQAVLTLIPEGPQCSAADGGRCVACPSLLSFCRWGSGSVPCCAGVIHWPGAACGDAVARSRRAWRSRRSWARARAGPPGSGWNNFGCFLCHGAWKGPVGRAAVFGWRRGWSWCRRGWGARGLRRREFTAGCLQPGRQ